MRHRVLPVWGGMDGHFFVSYSRADGAEFAERLADRLVAADPEAETERTGARISAGLEQQRHRGRSEADPARTRFVNTPPAVALGYFRDGTRSQGNSVSFWVPLMSRS